MFRRLFRPLWQHLSRPKALLTTSTIFAYTLLRNPIKLESPPAEAQPQSQPEVIKDDIQEEIVEYLRNLKQVEVCQSISLREGQRKVVYIKDHKDVQRRVIVTRHKGKLLAFLGSCTHAQPFDKPNTDYSLENAMIFNDKMYCPHHGCIFDIKSGSVEHGPAFNILPRFHASQAQGKIKLLYPSAIPTSVAPESTTRDVEDLRKVLILGGDDAATVGCLNSLRQFGFQGEVTVVQEGLYTYPYKKQYLHKSLINLNIDHQTASQAPKADKKTSNSKFKVPVISAKAKSQNKEAQINQLIEDELQKRIYSKLKFYPDHWYDESSIDFVFTDQPYRIINKQYYPYIAFNDGTRMEFDALMVATGLIQKLPAIESVTIKEKLDLRSHLPQNVFSPLRSKHQHIKLNKFLNMHKIEKLLVLGYNMESLEFVHALKQTFPDIKVSVIDTREDSQVSEVIGPQIESHIAKEFTSRGVQFFIKIRDELFFSNKFGHKYKERKRLTASSDKKNQPSKQEENSPEKFKDSVTVRISDELRIKADGVVIFPHDFEGNTEWVRRAKYTDFEYFHNNRLSGDNFCRTDNIRIFSAGLSSTNQYYLLNKRMVTPDPLVAYEQGFNTGLNMQALRIPFTYVPQTTFQFFGKKLFYVGTRDFYDSMLIIGSVEDWDFLAFYAAGDSVRSVSGTPSRTKQLATIREALRINCMASFEDLVTGYWSAQSLVNLIRKLDRSGCYRDIIFANRDNIHKKDLIWMERTHGAGYENDRPQMAEEYASEEVGADGKLKQV